MIRTSRQNASEGNYYRTIRQNASEGNYYPPTDLDDEPMRPYQSVAYFHPKGIAPFFCFWLIIAGMVFLITWLALKFKK